MPLRRLYATFTAVEPVAFEDEVLLRLVFRPERTRRVLDAVEHLVSLGPEPTVRAVDDLGMVLRILRAARIAAPPEPLALLGRPDRACALLERALGASLRIAVRPRTRLRFLAWTETGVEVVEDVEEVHEARDAWYVKRRGGRFPVRVPRDGVVRRRTETCRWLEVLEVERAPAA